MASHNFLLPTIFVFLISRAAFARPLRLCHTNDFHARYAETNSGNSACDATASAAGDCFSGIARVAAAFTMLKCDLRIQAGDFVQGTIYDTVFREQIAVAAYRWARYDIATLGNHEFDFGNAPVYNTVTHTSNQIVWLNANVDFPDGAPPTFGMAPFVDMHAVCWTAVLTKDTMQLARPDAGTRIWNEVAAVRAAIARCAQRDRVIAITHQGFAADVRLCKQVGELDLVIGGHSHTNLDQGRYPVRVTRADGSICYVAQAYAFGRYVGVLDVEFDDDGAISLPAHMYVPMDARVDPDPVTAAALMVYTDQVGDGMKKVVGEVTGSVDGSSRSCRSGECEMGNLVADAMLREGAKSGAIATIINSGGIRASFEKGPVTVEDVFTVLPFGNVHILVTLPGTGIVNMLEHGFTAFDHLDHGGRFPQVAGMVITADFWAPSGRRVKQVSIGGEPLHDERLYKIVTNAYIAAGGDGYTSVAEDASSIEESGRPLYELLKDYLEVNNPYTPFVEDRIVNVGSST